jgi:hypothetical protein
METCKLEKGVAISGLDFLDTSSVCHVGLYGERSRQDVRALSPIHSNGLESRLAGQIRDVMVEYLNCTIDLTCSIA